MTALLRFAEFANQLPVFFVWQHGLKGYVTMDDLNDKQQEEWGEAHYISFWTLGMGCGALFLIVFMLGALAYAAAVLK